MVKLSHLTHAHLRSRELVFPDADHASGIEDPWKPQRGPILNGSHLLNQQPRTLIGSIPSPWVEVSGGSGSIFDDVILPMAMWGFLGTVSCCSPHTLNSPEVWLKGVCVCQSYGGLVTFP